jgi:transposase
MASPYTPEFKQQAVRLVEESGLSIREAAEDLGVATESVRNWVKQARVDAGDADGLTTDEKAELARLRRENRVLKQEREILKRAAVWFAKETGSTP